MSRDRKQIIALLKEEFEKDDSVYALWLEGADALNAVDKYSDLDVWIDVKDGFEEKVMEKIEKTLSKIALVDFSFEKQHPHPKIRQKFFHLKGSSEFFIIDVCLQSHSRKFWYSKENQGEKVKILFDNAKIIKFRKLNKKKFRKEMLERAKALEKTFLFFQCWVKKEVFRNRFLDALKYYHSLVLEPLVEILRIRFEPTKRDFHLKQVSKDLPKGIVKRVEKLYKVGDIKEILPKTEKANKLFFKTVKEIKKR